MGASTPVSEQWAPPWMARPLLILLLAAQVLAVGGISLWAGAALLDHPAEASSASVFVAAGALAVASLPLSYRWLRAGVQDLLAAREALEGSPLAGLRRQPAHDPGRQLAALAGTISQVLDAAGVTIEVWPSAATPAPVWSWRAGVTATTGDTTRSIEAAVSHAGRSLGVVRAAPRRRRGFSATEARRLQDLTDHVALVVSSAVLREELEASRERLVLAREEERRRIRRDLHDGLGPSLAAIKLQLAATRRQLAASPAQLRELDELRTMVGEATDEVRRVIEDLRPPLLDDCGLAEAVRNLRFVPPTLQLQVDAPTPLPPLPAAVEVALYRIAAEAVHNTVRHAAASRCVVTIGVHAGRADLVVRDDGHGIPDGTPAGVGCAAIIERARELGGTVSIGTEPGGGTCVRAAIPLRSGGAA
ncbi:MAG: sensor histidine kinase [Microbacteriaceae bacterium]